MVAIRLVTSCKVGKNGIMPKPPNPDRKKPPRIALRREIAAVVEQYANEEKKDLTDVVNDAVRYYFAQAFDPPRWPARDKVNDGR